MSSSTDPFNRSSNEQLKPLVQFSEQQIMQNVFGHPLPQAVGLDPIPAPQFNQFMLGQNGNNIPFGPNQPPIFLRYNPYPRAWTPVDTDQIFHDFLGLVNSHEKFKIGPFCKRFADQHNIKLGCEAIKKRFRTRVGLFLAGPIIDQEDLDLKERISEKSNVEIPPAVRREYENKINWNQNVGGEGANVDPNEWLFNQFAEYQHNTPGSPYEYVGNDQDEYVGNDQDDYVGNDQDEYVGNDQDDRAITPGGCSLTGIPIPSQSGGAPSAQFLRQAEIKMDHLPARLTTGEPQLNCSIKEEPNRPLKVPETDAYSFLFVVLNELEQLNSGKNKKFEEFLKEASAKISCHQFELSQKKLNQGAVRFELNGIAHSEFSKEPAETEGVYAVQNNFRVPKRNFLEALKGISMAIGPMSTQLGSVRQAIDDKINATEATEEILLAEVREPFEHLMERFIQ